MGALISAVGNRSITAQYSWAGRRTFCVWATIGILSGCTAFTRNSEILPTPQSLAGVHRIQVTQATTPGEVVYPVRMSGFNFVQAGGVAKRYMDDFAVKFAPYKPDVGAELSRSVADSLKAKGYAAGVTGEIANPQAIAEVKLVSYGYNHFGDGPEVAPAFLGVIRITRVDTQEAIYQYVFSTPRWQYGPQIHVLPVDSTQVLSSSQQMDEDPPRVARGLISAIRLMGRQVVEPVPVRAER